MKCSWSFRPVEILGRIIEIVKESLLMMLGRVEISGESIFLWPSHSSKRIYSLFLVQNLESYTCTREFNLC